MIRNAESSSGIIEKTVLVRCSPAILFAALTNPEALTEWFCDKAACDLRVGGELQAQWSYGKHARRGRAVIRRLEADSHIELEWIDDCGETGVSRQPHILRFAIRSRRDGCELRVHDEGSPLPDAESQADFEEGWISVLRDLKEYCESLERTGKNRR